MARRLTTNQEIAGSIPASVIQQRSSLELRVSFAFVDSDMVMSTFGHFWDILLGAAINFDRIDPRLDLYQRHEEQLSSHLFRSIQFRFFVMWWSYEVAWPDLLKIETGAGTHQTLTASWYRYST
jgi:hypothetical protein